MAARAHSAPARHRARPTTHPAPRGAPGAEGDRLRIRWPPTGVPDGQPYKIFQELRTSTAVQATIQANHTRTILARRCTATWLCIISLLFTTPRTSAHAHYKQTASGAIQEKATRSGCRPPYRGHHASGTITPQGASHLGMSSQKSWLTREGGAYLRTVGHAKKSGAL